MLDAKDLEILFNLQENPLAPISSIAKSVNMSISGTGLRIERLTNHLKAFNRIHTDLNLNALELEIHDFFFRIESSKSLAILEDKFAFFHPYLSYRARCYGKFSGLYLQFRVPKKSYYHLIAIAEKLLDYKIISKYEYVNKNQIETPVVIKSAIRSWDSLNKLWTFDWKDWQNNFSEVSPTSIASANNIPSILKHLTEFDIKLLSQLTYDARKKNTDLIKILGLEDNLETQEKITQRLNYLRTNAISDYRIFLDSDVFDLYQTAIIRGYCSKNIARRLRNYLLLSTGKITTDIQITENLKFSTFPFQSVFYITEEGFQWYIRAPHKHLSELFSFIWEISPKHDIFWTSYNSSLVYALWDQTFDGENHTWKKDHDFMVQNVLDKL